MMIPIALSNDKSRVVTVYRNVYLSWEHIHEELNRSNKFALGM